jgi:hypothetical protein
MLVPTDFDRERHALVPWRMSADMGRARPRGCSVQK